MAEKRQFLIYGTVRNFRGLKCQKCQKLVADASVLVRTVGGKAICARCSYGSD